MVVTNILKVLLWLNLENIMPYKFSYPRKNIFKHILSKSEMRSHTMNTKSKIIS